MTDRILLDAADLLESHGWCQGRLTNRYGRHCVVGAILAVDKEECLDVVMTKAVGRLAAYLGVAPISLSLWNDKRGRTREEVVSALRAA